jgi:hypothetical protein
VAWVDNRVQGPQWQGAFDRLRATDPKRPLGPLPLMLQSDQGHEEAKNMLFVSSGAAALRERLGSLGSGSDRDELKGALKTQSLILAKTAKTAGSKLNLMRDRAGQWVAEVEEKQKLKEKQRRERLRDEEAARARAVQAHVRDALVEIYRQQALPEKQANVPALLEQFRGREIDLLEQVCAEAARLRGCVRWAPQPPTRLPPSPPSPRCFVPCAKPPPPPPAVPRCRCARSTRCRSRSRSCPSPPALRRTRGQGKGAGAAMAPMLRRRLATLTRREVRGAPPPRPPRPPC